MFLVPGQGFQTFIRLTRKTAVTGTGRPWDGGLQDQGTAIRSRTRSCSG